MEKYRNSELIVHQDGEETLIKGSEKIKAKTFSSDYISSKLFNPSSSDIAMQKNKENEEKSAKNSFDKKIPLHNKDENEKKANISIKDSSSQIVQNEIQTNQQKTKTQRKIGKILINYSANNVNNIFHLIIVL